MQVTFRTYCGLAGDLQELLILETSTGIKLSRLYNRASFKSFNQKRAKRKLQRELKNLTA
jgi:hypothetical protein